MSVFYVDLALLKQGKIFDALVPGSFIDMLGRKVTFKKAEMKTYLKNTLDAVQATKTESGEIVGLPIDARGHDKGDGAGWIVDAKLEDGKIRLVPKWTKIGQDLISEGIRRMFSPTVDTEQKIILGGTLTNWPATRDKKGKVMLRPIELEEITDPLFIVDENQEFEETDPEQGTEAELAESLNEKSSAVRSAFRDQFLPKQEKALESTPWVIDVFEDHAIVQDGSKYFSAPFDKDDKGKVKFSKRKEWKEVKKSWVEAALDQLEKASAYLLNVFRGNDPDAEQTDSNLEVLEMEMTQEQLKELIVGVVAEMTTAPPSDPDADPVDGDPEAKPRFDMLRLFEMEGANEEFRAAVKKQMTEYYDQQRSLLMEDAAEEIAKVHRESGIAEFVSRVTQGNEENPRGISVEPDALKTFILGLDPDQAKFTQDLIEKIVSGHGVVEFAELGNSKPVEGVTELPKVVQDKLTTGEMKITELDSPILGLGDLSKYNLEKWREKSDA